MRRSYSYSKRDVLERCARKYYYEYYASSKKAPVDPVRKTLIQRLKQMSNRHLIAGQILHRLIRIRLKKGREWRATWFLQNAAKWFDQHISYSRNPERNADMLRDRYPPSLLTEFYYDVPEAEILTREIRERLLVALKNFLENAEVVSPYNGLVDSEFAVEQRISGLRLDGYVVAGSIDFVVSKNLSAHIVDWKMGLPNGNHDSLQLFIYGLWASEKLHIEAREVTVRRVFLGDGTVERGKRLDKTSLRRGRARLFQDIELMEEMDPFGRAGVEGAFSRCEKEGLCCECKYREACQAMC